MKIKITVALVLFSLSVLLSGDKHSYSSAAAEGGGKKRIRFQVVTVEEKSNQRSVLSQTTIEGLAGTDFNINLQTGNFKMQALFLSDLVEPERLKIRARLNTRRFYGYSPINLPLYEEDAQNQTLLLGFDETIVLLPFGRNGGGENLKIEITPTLLTPSSASSPGAGQSDDRLKINIDKPLPNGELLVEASKIPHNFEIETVLLADGREVARSVKNVLFEEQEEIVLTPVEKADPDVSARPLTAKFRVGKFTRSRPADYISFDYQIYRAQTADSATQAEVVTGAGVVELGRDLVYQLDKSLAPGDKKYELKFRIRLAQGERGE